jgi:uncharacterized protein YggT (Ycf19 family)
MDGSAVRLLLLINVVVPLLFFMAWIYLLLHILFASVIRRPDSPVLWFFGILTGPLTRPVRSVLPTGTAEPRVRTISLVVYILLWVVARVVLHQIAGGRAV